MNSLQNIKKQISKNRDQKQSIITELQSRLKGQEQMTKRLTDKLAQQKDKHLEYKISELYKLGYVYKQCSSRSEDNPKKYLIIDISTLKDEDDFVINNQVNFANKKQIDHLLQASNVNQLNGQDYNQLPNTSGKMLDRQINSLRVIVSQLRNEMNTLKKQYQQNFNYNKINGKENGVVKKIQPAQMRSQILCTPPLLFKQSQEESPKYQNNLQEKSIEKKQENIKQQNIKTEQVNKIQSLNSEEVVKNEPLNMKQTIIEQIKKEVVASAQEDQEDQLSEQKRTQYKEQNELKGDSLTKISPNPTQNLQLELAEIKDQKIQIKQTEVKLNNPNCDSEIKIIQPDVHINGIDDKKQGVQQCKIQDNEELDRPEKQLVIQQQINNEKQLPKQVQLRNSETFPLVKQTPQKHNQPLIQSAKQQQKMEINQNQPISTQKQQISENVIPLSQHNQYQVRILPIALDFSINMGKSTNEMQKQGKQDVSNGVNTLRNISHSEQNQSSCQFLSKSSHSSVLDKSDDIGLVPQRQLKPSIQNMKQPQKQQQKMQSITLNNPDNSVMQNISEKGSQDAKLEQKMIKQKQPEQKKEEISVKKQGSNTKINHHKKKTDSKADKKGSQLNWGSLFSSQSSNKKIDKQKNKQKPKEQDNEIKKFTPVKQEQTQDKKAEKEQKPASQQNGIKNSTQTVIIPPIVQTSLQQQIKQKENIEKQNKTEQIKDKTTNEISPVSVEPVKQIEVQKQIIIQQLPQKQRTQVTIDPINLQNVNPKPNQNKQELKQITSNSTTPIVILNDSQSKINIQPSIAHPPRDQQIPIIEQKDKASHQKIHKKEIEKQEDKDKHQQPKKKADGHKQQLNWGSLFSNFGQSNSKPKKTQKSDQKHEKTIKQLPNTKQKQKQKEKIQKELQKPQQIPKQENLIIESPNKKEQKQEGIFTTPPRKQDDPKIEGQHKSEQYTPTWNQISSNEQQEQSMNKQVLKSAEVKVNQYENEKKENKILNEQQIRIQKQRQKKRAQLQEQQELDRLLLELQMNQNNSKPISFNQKAQQIQLMSTQKDEKPNIKLEEVKNSVEFNENKKEENQEYHKIFKDNNSSQKDSNQNYGQSSLKNEIQKQYPVERNEVHSNKELKPLQTRRLSEQLKLNTNLSMKSQTTENLKAEEASHIPHTPQTPYPPSLQQMQPFKKDSIFNKTQTKHQHLRKAHSLINYQNQNQVNELHKHEKVMKKNQSPIHMSISGGSNSSPNTSPDKATPVIKKMSSENDNFLVISAEYSEKSDKNPVHIVPMKSQQLYKIQSKNQNEIQQNSSVHPSQNTIETKENPNMNTPNKNQSQQKTQKIENKQVNKVQQEKQHTVQKSQHKTTDKKRNKVIFLRK